MNIRSLCLPALMIWTLPGSARAAITTVVESGLAGAEVPAIIESSFGEDVLTFSDRAHQHNGAAFDSGTGLPNVNGGSIVPLPAYLTGSSYVRFANDVRDNTGYSATVTADVPTIFYLLIDNRLNGPAAAAKTNTTDPVLGGSLQWVIDGGWQRVNTGISPNGQGDYTAVDEAGNGTGAGMGLNQFYSVWKFPAVTTQVVVRNNGFGTQNNIALVGAVATTPGEPIVSFVPQPSIVSPGDAGALLTWIIDPAATSASIDQGIGNILPLTDANGSGSLTVTPAVDTTYTLSVTSPGGSETAPATVQVRALGSFQVSDNFINPGETVTLSWRVRADAAVSLSGFGDMDAQTDANGFGTFDVQPAASTVYTLTAVASGRTEEASIRVVTTPPGQTYAVIDIGATGGLPEPGAVSGTEIGAGPHNTNATSLPPVPLISDTGDEFTIGIENLDPFGNFIGALDWRDRGTAPAVPLAFLAEDFVKNNAGMIRVALGSLPAGTYNVISYHLDPDNSQCADIRILVTDANGIAADTTVRGDASFPAPPQSGGLNTGVVDSKGARFSITSNGVDDVMIYFDGTAATDTEVPLDALWLTQAPAAPAGLEVVNVTTTVAAGSSNVDIEFTSIPGRTYRVRASQDLTNWTDLTSSLPASAGATTTFTDVAIPPAIRRRFYQIIQN